MTERDEPERVVVDLDDYRIRRALRRVRAIGGASSDYPEDPLEDEGLRLAMSRHPSTGGTE